MSARTQEQILARFQNIDPNSDWLGFRREVLLGAMTIETAQAALDADLTGETWDAVTDTETAAREYLTFAIEKAADHRGISAIRSVDKLTEYAWLLGRDDVTEAMAAAGYAQYGVPKLKAFADGMGWPWPGDVPSWQVTALDRMSVGMPCDPDCVDGCDL